MQLVSVVLIAVAGAARYTAVVTSLSVVAGIIVCGSFLLIISIVGLVAASKHHQVSKLAAYSSVILNVLS